MIPRQRTSLPVACVLSLGVLTTGCGEEEVERISLDGERGTEAAAGSLPAELQEHLDAGNAAYRDGDYDEALGYFQRAVEAEPQLAAAWYGVGMTQKALGDAAAADSAMSVVHRLAPEVPLVHPDPDDPAPANPHPADPPPSEEGSPPGEPPPGDG